MIDGVAVVTGAGSGIGQECALAYAAEGARGVVLADLNYEAALKTAKESEAIATNPNYKALAVAVDVSNVESVDKMVQAAVDTFGRIDYSVNSAGVGVQKHLSIEETDLAEMNRFWQINVIGTFNCIQAVARVMKTQTIATVTNNRGKAREVGRGVILNLGSANSYMATAHITQYTTTKHAVIGLTKNAAIDLATHGIRVNAICPGWVDTPMVSDAAKGNPDITKMINSVVPMRRLARTEEISDAVLYMTSPRSSFVTGVGWVVDGGLTIQVKSS